MSIKREIELEIINFLERQDNLNKDDKRETLLNIFIKHLHLQDSEHLLGKYEFLSMVDRAKGSIVGREVRIELEDRELSYEEKNMLTIMEACIVELKRSGALNKNVKFKKNKTSKF